MDSSLLCWTVLCLLGAGPVDSGVTQTPSHLIKTRGQQVTLSCSPIAEHLSVFWYQQARDQGPKFLVAYYRGEEREKGNIPARFSGQQFSDYRSELNLSALEQGDSSVFLCASSIEHSPAEPPPSCAQTSCPTSGSNNSPHLVWPVMGSRLLCWRILCLLGAGNSGAGVSQAPRHRITQRGQAVVFKCDPVNGHTCLYWYRQTPGQGMEFLMYFQNTEAPDTSGMPDARFSAERPDGSSSTLKIQPVEPRDMAVYLCASSLATE
ncbi:PREDICTED: uncharacterized protein LOC102810579 [Chrysochloris asiatica]|uniref:Uncharacterized protein LOC102810579 n=1 Tax=Chrysochloris asiatica TaxID=185453 RepID=A0A9B0TF31_CHRAS|nr:PREDICTED: uncharacterized protein LOC102810579 [Chrysochloris asiatica]